MTAELRGWWRSWYGKRSLDCGCPPTGRLIASGCARAHAERTAQIAARLLSAHRHLKPPSPQGRRNACIAIDDMTRPTETFRILPHVLAELQAAGLRPEDILIIVSLGTHRPLTRPDLLKKVGLAVLQQVRIQNYNPYLNFTQVGITRFGTPLLINSAFAAADLKLSIGLIAPHAYAGFSAGGKIVLPGLASRETVLTNITS